MEKMFTKTLVALNAVTELLQLYGLNLYKQTINGERFDGSFDFRIFLYFLCQGVGVEIPRGQIIDDVYVPMKTQPGFRIKERSIDSFVVRINKTLERAKFEYRIRNFGVVKHPMGFRLVRVNAANEIIYAAEGEQ